MLLSFSNTKQEIDENTLDINLATLRTNLFKVRHNTVA